MERVYHNSDGFLMLRVQNVCIEPVLIFLNPILTELVMMVSPHHRHPLMICYQLSQGEWPNFCNLPLPRVCLSWQTTQTLMRCMFGGVSSGSTLFVYVSFVYACAYFGV